MKSIRLVGLAGLVCLVATCREAGLGPGSGSVVRLAISPQLPSRAEMAAFSISADSLRILVVRPPSAVVVDTTVYFHPDSTSLALAIAVELEAAAEDLDITVELRGGGFVLFSGTQTVNVQAGQSPAPTIALAFVGPGNNVDTLKLTPLDSVISFGDSLRYQVSAVDAAGNPVTQFYVSWTTSDTLVAKVNAAGVVYAPALRAGVQVHVRTPNGRADSTAVTFIPVPISVTAVSGGGQSAAPGTLLPQPLVAKVLAADALGVQGIVVHFQATLNGSVTSADVVTDAQGNAQTTATLGALVGPSTFRASVAGVATPATYTATVLSVGATHLAFATQPPATVTAGVTLAPAITVELRDALNQVDASANNAVTIALGANPGGATLGGTVTINAVNGVATFSTLSLNKAAPGYTLVATASGLTQATSSAITVGAAAASQLAVTAHPPSALAGTAFATPVVVQAQDAFGNLNATFAGVVSLGIGTNPGGGALAGSTAVAAVGGIATFSGLSIDNPGAGYTLVASAGGLTSDTSGTIAIAPPTAGRFWIASGGGNWSNPANWSGGIVPGANDTVTIGLSGTYTVTVDVNDTVAFLFVGGATGIQTFTAVSRTFGIDSGATFGASAVVNLHGTTINSSANGVFLNSGTLTIPYGTTQIGAPLAVTATGLVQLNGNNGNAILNVAGALSNQGTIELTGTSWGGILSVTGGFTNAPGATLHTLAGAGHTFTGELVNFGTVQVDNPLTLSGASATHLNSGTIVLGGSNLTLSQSGTTPSFTTDGTITIGAGRTLTVNGGTFAYAGGVLGGPGSMAVNNATFDLTPDFTHDTLTLAFTSSVVSGSGTLIVAGATPLTMQNTVVNASLQNEGTIHLSFGTNTFNAAYNHGPGALLQLNGNNGNAILNSAGAFVNQGTIELTGTSWGGVLNMGGTLTNSPGATLHAATGSGHTFNGELDNQGTVLIDDPLTINGASAAHLNSGTITLVSGDLLLNQSGATPSFTTTGTVTIGPGRTWTVTGGAVNYDSGAVQGTGVLALNSATLNLTPDFVHDTLALSLTSSAVNGPGSLTVASGATLVLSNSVVNAPLVNQGTLRGTFGTSALNGPYTHAPGAMLHLTGTNGNAILNVDSSFTNQGTIELTGTSWGGTLSVGGTLTNAPGATLHAGAGASHFFIGTLNNQGTVTIDNPLQVSGPSAAHVNSGTISLAGGNLVLNQSGTTPSFTNTGSITIDAGRTLTVSSGALHYNGGSIAGTGVLALSGATLNLTPDFVHDTLALTLTSSVVNGPGTLTIAAGATLVMTSSTVNAPLVDQGTLQGNFGTNTLNGAFTLDTGAVLLLVGNNGNAILNVDSSFTNQGTIELTGTSWGGVVSVTGTLTNAPGATFHAGAGANHTLTGSLNNQGSVLIDNLLTLNGTSATHVSTGTITLAGGNLTLSQSGVTPSFTTSGTIDIGPGRTWSVSGGSLTYAAGAIGGTGLLALSNATLNLTPNFTHDTLALSLTGSVVNGPGTLTVAGPTPLILVNSTVNAPLENQGFLQGNFGTNTVNGPFTNAPGAVLLLAGTNGNAILNVDSSFTNEGSIQLTGTGWGGSLAVSGTLTNAPGGLLHAVTGTNHFITATLANQGSLQVDQPLTLNGVAATHLNTGNIGLGGGNLTLTQSGSFTNRGIVDIGAGRTATVTGGSLVNDTAGTLRGTGTLSVTGTSFSNTGAVSPGTSPGQLTITGPFPMAPAAVLNIELGGLTAGTQYDRLAVSGTATLGGILNVTLLPGFTPAVADSFAILTCGTCGGTFGQMILPAGMSASVVGNTVIVTQVTLVSAGTVSWIAGSGLWSNPANWSAAAVPSSSDTVRIDFAGTYTVTLDVNATVGRLVLGGGSGTQTLSGNGRTLTLGDGGTILSSGALNLTGNSAIIGGGTLTNQGAMAFDGDIAVALVNQGSLALPGGALVNLLGAFTQSGSVALNGNSGPATLTTASSFTNQGSIVISGTSWGGVITVASGAGLLTNAPAATVHAQSGVNHSINAGFDNQGTVQADAPLAVFLGGQAMTTTAGTLAVGATRTLRVDGGTLHVGSGTVQSGTGTIDLTGTSTLDLVSDVTFASPGAGPQWSFGGTVTVSGAGALTNLGTLLLTDDVVNTTIDNQGTLELPGGSQSQITGALVGQTGLLRINGNSGPAALTTAAGFTNNGTIELTGTVWGGQLNVGGGNLTNAAGATMVATGGVGNGITAVLDQQGTVHVAGPLAIAPSVLGTTGTFDVDAGRTLTLTGGVLLGSGTVLTGTGTIAVAGPASTVALATDLTIGAVGTAPQWSFPGTVAIDGPGRLINLGTLPLTDDVVNADFDNQGTLDVPGGSSSGLTGAVTQTGTIHLVGNNGPAVLAINGSLTNDGVIELGGTAWGGTLSVGVALTNGAAGVLQASSGVGNTLAYGAFTNLGTVHADGPLAWQSGGGAISTTGTIDVAAGRTLTVANGSLEIGSGTTLSGTGTIDVVGLAALNLASDVTFAVGAPQWTFGGTVTVNGPGILTNQATLALTDDAVTTDLTNQGTLEIPGGSASTLSGLFTNTGTLRLAGDNGPAALTAQSFSNGGIIELSGTSWGGQLTVLGTLTNPSGSTIRVVNGVGNTLNAASLLAHQGLLFIDGPLTVVGTNVNATTGTLQVKPGRTLTLDDLALTIGSVTTLLDTGTIALTGPFTLALAGDVTIAPTAPRWTFPGAVTVNGPGKLTNLASLQLTDDVVNAAFDNQGKLELPGGSSSQVLGALTQSGTLTMNGNNGPADLTVGAGFTNTGSIELTGTSWGGTLAVASGTLTNAPGATVQALNGVGNVLNAILDNQGDLIANGPVTLLHPSGTHQSSGSIALTGGDLTLAGTGGGGYNLITTGPITVDGGRTLRFNDAGEWTFGGGVVSGAGTLELNLDVQFNLNVDFTLTDLTLKLTNAAVNPSGGTRLIVAPTGTALLRGLTTGLNINTVLENHGLVNVQGGLNFQNDTLRNAATGTVRVEGAGTFSHAALTLGVRSVNQGLWELTSSVGGFNATVNGNVPLINEAGGQVVSVVGAGGGRTLGVQLDNQGSLLVQANLTVNNGTGTLSNAGVVDVVAPRVLTVSGGTFNNIAAGVLRGAGSVDVTGTTFSNAGAINPGPGAGGPGILTLTGSYPSTATSTVNVELGGLTPGIQYDRLAVSGAGTIAGLLNVTLVPGFTPAVNDSFTVITCATGCSGGFGQQILPLGMTAAILGNNVILSQASLVAGALVSWIGGAGNWSTPANWSGGVVPTSLDTAVINANGTYTVTLDVDATVARLMLGGGTGTQTLSGAGRKLTMGTGSTILPSGALSLTAGGTLDGAALLTNQGTITLTGSTANAPIANQRLLSVSTSTLNGQVTTAGGDTVRIGAGGAGTTTFTKGFTVNGRLQYRIPSGTNVLAVVQGPLVVAPLATFEVLAAGGAAGTFTGTLDNQGTVTNAVALTINGASAAHSNTGTIALGGSLTVAQSGTSPSFTNGDSIIVPSGLIFTVSGGGPYTQTAAGSLSGQGTARFIALSSADFTTPIAVRRVTMDGTPVTLDASQTVAGRWTVTDVALSGAATITVGAADTLDFTNGGVDLSLVNQGLLRAVGTFDLNSALTTAGGSTLRLGNIAGATTGGGTITVANGFTNTGNLELQSTGGSVLTLVVSAGTLVNASGGTLLNDPTGAGTRRLNATLDNQGTVTVNHPLNVIRTAGAHTNSGTINIASGQTLIVDNGGTLTVPTGSVLGLGTLDARTAFTTSVGTTVNLGGLSLAGSLSIGGSYTVGTTTFTGASPAVPVLPYTNLVMNGTGTAGLVGNTNVTGNLNITRGVLGLVGQTVNVGGNLAVSGTGTGLTLGAASVTVNGGFSTAASGILNMTNGSGILTVNGNVSFGGGGTNGVLTAGRIFARGNFSQVLGATSAFGATGTHRVVLDGTGTQTVTFASAGSAAANSHFQNLELLNTAGTIPMGSNIFVNGALQSTPGAGVPKVVGGGFLITTAGLNVTGLQLDRALLKFATSGLAAPTFQNVNFVNFLENDIQFNIEHPGLGSVMIFSNINFTPFTTGTGYYLRVDDTDDIQPNLLQILISHWPIDANNAIARTLKIGTLPPGVTWQL